MTGKNSSFGANTVHIVVKLLPVTGTVLVQAVVCVQVVDTNIVVLGPGLLKSVGVQREHEVGGTASKIKAMDSPAHRSECPRSGQLEQGAVVDRTPSKELCVVRAIAEDLEPVYKARVPSVGRGSAVNSGQLAFHLGSQSAGSF